MGFSVTVVPALKVNGEAVSSTAIRKALARGDMKKVYNMAGRLFSLRGRVTTGAGRGVELGFPTANLKTEPGQAMPADGVYATRAYIDGKGCQSMTNIGTSPTFGDGERRAEVYILDYHGDLYGQELKLDIVERLRDEQKFDTIEALKKQMAEDVKHGKSILDSEERN